ncbi:MAG TPA: hydantoinase/oxoprolinase family protein [Thermomicrobiaceae bacterium]|nr:hydantoinase/oxoprolinase family protein [Thermomicrobiaceae bacterium]
MERYRLGVDIGGTFTDFLLMDEATGRYAIAKVASTPDHPSEAILTGLARLEDEQGIAAARIASFVHGTTLAVNTLIQRSGARTGLLVTEGYRDILELRRLRLADPSQLYSDKPAPLASRRDVREIRERLLADGSEYLPLDLDQVEAAARELVEQGVASLAVAFLHSYVNPAHELAARARIERALPGVYVCTSAEIWPQFREYERTLVAVMNAHVGQRMADYFTALDAELRDAGLQTPIFSTKSNGGIMTARHAAAVPVETLLSGPASGVIGAAYIARQIGEPHVITFDMGGTSADVSVISGDVSYSTESHVGEFPVVMPVVDVSSIGAGGGSVAWIDREGVLKVGPRSVGASPGPACYDRGGTDATVTDAYVELGILDPAHFLGGELVLRPELAHDALARVGERLGCGPAEAARHVLAVATANMYAEFVPLMGRRGIDARDYSLLAYGGAGPTHAFMLAREVGIARVIVPPTPGVLCALGCLIADFRADFIKTLYAASADLAAGELEASYRQVEEQALAWLREQHLDLNGAAERSPTALVRSADMRYHGQSFEITVPAPAPLADAPGVPDLLDAFHEQYARVYGTSDREAPVEVISIRVQVIGQTPKPRTAGSADGTGEPRPAPEPMDRRAVRLEETTWEVPVYARAALEPGMALAGPCIVEQYDSTVFVTPEFDVRVDPSLNLIGTRVREQDPVDT